MWVEFVAATLFALICLVLPGFLLLRARGLRWEFSLGVAPAVTTVAYGALSSVFGLLGVPCGWPTLLLPLCLLGLVLLALHHRRGEMQRSLGFDRRLETPFAKEGTLSLVTPVRLAMLLAVAAAVTTSLFVYVFSLGDPNSFLQNYDNAWHLSRIHEFVQTANYSPLGGGFYPSAWHTIAALAESGLGVSTAVAEHAANLAFIIGAYPAASVFLLAALFPDKPRRVVVGGALCLIFAFFPWRIMLFGPLYPNLAAFTMMPSEAALFMLLFADGLGCSERLRYGTLFVLGGIAMVFAQPNAIFSTGVFLMPFCVWRMREYVSQRLINNSHRQLLSVGAAALLALVFLVIWIALAKAPFMKSIVEYQREPLLSLGQALRWGLGYSFVIRRQQFFIAAVVAVGALALLLRPRRRWLVASYIMLLGIYVVAVSMEGTMQHLVAGFWYSDYYRLAAAVCVFSVPLVATGMDVIIGGTIRCARWLSTRVGFPGAGLVAGSCVSGAIVLVILALHYVPFDFIEWYYRSYGFDAVAYEMRDLYQNEANWSFDEDERVFAARARGLVPEGERVLNVPFDGSAFSYSTCGLEVVYDSFSIDQNPDAALLRTELNQIAEDERVRSAAESLGVEYVLLLDQGDGPDGFGESSTYYVHGYDKKLWAGITSIDDETPGLERVLAEGDMRLYRLED